MSRAGRAFAFLGLLSLLVAGAPHAGAQSTNRQQERERIRRERAALAADMDVLRADSAKVEEALQDLERRLAYEESVLASARQAQAAAEAQAQDAARRAAAAANEIARLEAETRQAAIRAFMTGDADSDGWDASTGMDLRAAASRGVLQRVVTSTADDLADQLAAAREDHQVAQAAAEDAATQAAERADAARSRLGAVEEAKQQQAAFASDLDARIEARLAEAANLEALDKSIAAAIVREQQDLERRARALPRSTTVRRLPSSGSVPLANVRGIVVHVDIADQLRALLAAADAAGFSLGGGGYRDSSQQQRLREQNCPNPETSPASSCRPPTARPGASMHERGIAVDFTSGGRLIESRSNPAFRWLADNAGRFGFQNLPSEPWHWSTNGR